ncbi:uncharacterized protein LOC124293162 isoform X2 [Neodiprion lecontei]|uniref:Uncharacterized protein LOC124293162 isoform X2 n=1 Tax=Neodiprion lecontei TaxID=441921 RepID=A0ABM3FLS0_NEOLC|nr:uncharacterized protein LOC124293162 isoform X2 [Neodiprion lecontei]
MPRKCDVVNCRNRLEKHFHFFTLPKNEEHAAEWIRFSGREKTINRKDFRICSKHFPPDKIWKLKPRPLQTHDAVPSLYGLKNGSASKSSSIEDKTSGATVDNLPQENEVVLQNLVCGSSFGKIVKQQY